MGQASQLPAMVAVVRSNPSTPPCVVRWVGRKGLSVKIITWCASERDAGSGVEQIPTTTACCPACSKVLVELAGASS